MNEPTRAICIGGSAGSFQPLIELLTELVISDGWTVFVCIHRGKHSTENFCRVLSSKTGRDMIEPSDKDPVLEKKIYLAPQNYHLTMDRGGYISLMYEDEVNFSRPSIDVMFKSVSKYFLNNTVGIILSGANKDGKAGMEYISKNGGICISQDPDEASVATMPESCLNIPGAKIMRVNEIAHHLNLMMQNFKNANSGS